MHRCLDGGVRTYSGASIYMHVIETGLSASFLYLPACPAWWIVVGGCGAGDLE